jgi:hypothetical protein
LHSLALLLTPVPALQITFAEWLVQVAARADSPLVMSISYGEYESATGEADRQQFNQAAMKLGVQVGPTALSVLTADQRL